MLPDITVKIKGPFRHLCWLTWINPVLQYWLHSQREYYTYILCKEMFGWRCIHFLSDHLRYLEGTEKVFDTSAFLWLRAAASFKLRAIALSLNQVGQSMRHFQRRVVDIWGEEGCHQRDTWRKKRQRELNNCHLRKSITVYFLLWKVRKASSMKGLIYTPQK